MKDCEKHSIKDKEIMATEEDICFDATCKHERKSRKGNKKMDCIQCTVCWKWYHDDCVGIGKNEHLGAWPCPPCRIVPSYVKQIFSMVSTLNATVNDLKTVCEASADQLIKLKTEYEEMRSENDELKRQIEQLKRQVKEKEKEVFTEGNCCHLVIGDSLLKSIDESKLQNTTVQCLPGAEISDVLHKLNDTDDIFMDVTVCVGTNDCGKDDFVVGALTDTYRQIVTAAKEKVQDVSKVKVVSIPPRTDDRSNQEKVASLNASLCALAEETGAKFINNDPVFLLQDGSPNDGYLHLDGVHLNVNGTNRLAKNMGVLPKEQYKRNVCKDANTQNRNRTDWPQKRPGNFQDRSFNGNRQHNRNATNGPPRRKCWNCGELNHNSSNCRHGHPIKCNQCHILGHKAKFCGRR